MSSAEEDHDLLQVNNRDVLPLDDHCVVGIVERIRTHILPLSAIHSIKCQ